MEYDRFQEILQEEAEKIPEKFYEGLNGGVIISEETKLSPYAQNNDCRPISAQLPDGKTDRNLLWKYDAFIRLS